MSALCRPPSENILLRTTSSSRENEIACIHIAGGFMMEELFSLGDAAKVLQTQAYVIQYCLATGKVPEPRRIGGRRMFSHADLATLSDFLKRNPRIDDVRGAGDSE
jgi:hypothetical protein